jgi:hypothetical protein
VKRWDEFGRKTKVSELLKRQEPQPALGAVSLLPRDIWSSLFGMKSNEQSTSHRRPGSVVSVKFGLDHFGKLAMREPRS